jgi:hypothetical protein
MKEKGFPKFSAAVAATVEEQIHLELSKYRLVENRKLVDLNLHVIIDDAGGETFKEYFQTSSHIHAIISAIEKDMSFRFLQQVHLTVVGCCLETLTKFTSTLPAYTKFYMQPWKSDHVNALIRESFENDSKFLKDVLRRFSEVRSLISNARCTSYLLNLLSDNKGNPQGAVSQQHVALAIFSVAKSFIASTGLKNVESIDDKWAIARSVFRVVNKASLEPRLAFFPKVDELKTEALRNTAISLLDVNVVSEDDEPSFNDDKRVSATISTALVMVLFVLLNEDKASAASWDWQAFEATGGLSEWQSMVANSPGNPNDVGDITRATN